MHCPWAYNTYSTVHVYVYGTSHGLLYCVVNNLFLIWIVHTRTVVVPCIIYTHVLITLLTARALFGIQYRLAIGVCSCMYMCTHNCVWYGNHGSMCVNSIYIIYIR